ncbi:hypothetical protein [Bradyrhizobium jicamae]|uniref:hypothetical protein n=1 Tax=Bradyrhizobium jicamae TaxID=280332 RepID=UPI002012FD41|nr:hypothetical protein [Bradyrhizobium jicamae]
MMANEVDQQIEDAWLHCDLLPRAQHNAASFIKLERSKYESHVDESGVAGKGSGKDQTMISPR